MNHSVEDSQAHPCHDQGISVEKLGLASLNPSRPHRRIDLLGSMSYRTGIGREPSQLDVIVAVIVGIFTVAWAPIFITGTVPRLSIAYGLAPLGLGSIVFAARRGDRTAFVAIGACSSIILSGVLAEAPRASFVGQLPEWASVIALVSSIGWWGVGRSLTDAGRSLLAGALAVGAVLNGMVAMAQLAVGSKDGEMFVASERGAGLMTNPVFFGSFMIGVAGIWLAIASQRRSVVNLSLCAALMFFSALSGGRVVLGAAAMLMAACAVIWRRAAAWPVVVSLIGFVIGDRTLNLFSSQVSSVDRIAGGESIGSRLSVWRFGLDAFADRPIFGWGPANAELAVMRRIDLAFVQDQWSEGSVLVWWDPHNLLVFSLVSLGLVGTVAIFLLVAASIRGERYWPALLAVLAMGATWTLQPFTVHTLPIAMLLLGAAARQSSLPPDEADPPDEIGSVADGSASMPAGIERWQRAAVGVGATVTIALLTASFLVERWSFSNRPDDAARAAVVFGGDPWLDSYVSNAYLRTFSAGVTDPALLDQAVKYSRRSSEVFPTSQQLQDLADLSVTLGDLATASQALELAVELEPWDPAAWTRVYSVAVWANDDDLADLAERRLCSFSEFWCGFAGAVDKDVEASPLVPRG